jgi:hypothetical protein
MLGAPQIERELRRRIAALNLSARIFVAPPPFGRLGPRK